ncbi:MAG: hypothetical protein M5R42_18170 [Rhodocyclaceae bacterium]|nr:hypothetical protein [Rhodocyclaceae bacterium]
MILLKSDFLRLLVDQAGTLIPSIGKASTFSAITDIAAIYWASMWLIVLIWLPFYFLLSDEQIRPFELVEEEGRFLFAPILVMPSYTLCTSLPIDGSSQRVQAMLGSRIGLAVIGGMLFPSVPLFIRVLFMWWHYMPRLLQDKA